MIARCLIICGILHLILAPQLIAQEEFRDTQEVQQTIEEILAHPDYQQLNREKEEEDGESDSPEWLDDFLDWLFGEPERMETGEAVFNFGAALTYLAIAVLVAILIVIAINMLTKICFGNFKKHTPSKILDGLIT